MTPAEFKERMQKIKDQLSYDDESVHGEMDHLLVECLRSLGYGEGCDIWYDQYKAADILYQQVI